MATTRELPADATTGGLAYHRLVFARRRRGWWTPLVVGAVGLALYAALLAVIMVAIIVASLVDPAVGSWMLSLGTEVTFDLADPLMLLFVLGTIVLMLPAYLVASRLINGPRVGLSSSAAGRLRWRWMLLCGAVAVGLYGVLTAVSLLLPGEELPASVLTPAENPQFWASLAVLLLIVPFQAAAEEYVFRGYLMQAIGRWLRHPAFAILLPVPLFVFGHLYDPIGLASVGLFAIAAGWLTWRTGGLEAAIALHVVNNLSAFLTALAGYADVNSTSPGWASLVSTLLVELAFVGIIELLWRRRRMPRTLRLTPPPAPPVVVPPPPYVPAGAADTGVVPADGAAATPADADAMSQDQAAAMPSASRIV